MRRWILLAAAALAVPALAEDAPVTPNSVIAAAPASDWVAINPVDLLVMDLAPDRDGHPRRVVIQLMPAPFSQGWVANIRTLAAAHWWDGTSINRVQDNYVVQWGDVTEKKPLPDGLKAVPESEYGATDPSIPDFGSLTDFFARGHTRKGEAIPWQRIDAYTSEVGFAHGWPIGMKGNKFWPAHCYGMVGVGRNVSPDTGTGAELYTVIGQAPRQLDRNIALVGRIVEGMENLSSLPRGHGDLGFYADDEADKRVPILSVRLGNDLASSSEAVGQQGNAKLPRFEYLSTESKSFAAYAYSRANRKDDFYIQPAGGVDICNVPVPIRHAKS
ncbi:MAG: peptidylprolyl isomerase [Candidatus Andeanibacterium colombiense]|uniref:Peptidylprolyl isomerase n=1 Tax=Candidatus Andeanibacterium colombiense TaxID=3121345 RepID=A0AAJ6BNV0_9SPHN|nr:MAG: peptidylprolyl isomerase [Sphingomonadaceae bacterium]